MDVARNPSRIKAAVAFAVVASLASLIGPARAESLVSSFPQGAWQKGPAGGLRGPWSTVEPYGGKPVKGRKRVSRRQARQAGQTQETLAASLTKGAAVLASIMFFSSDEDWSTSTSSSQTSTGTQGSSGGGTSGGGGGINQVPEPTSLIGGLIGTAIVGWYGWRRRGRRSGGAVPAT
jgi:hypothetical protein